MFTWIYSPYEKLKDKTQGRDILIHEPANIEKMDVYTQPKGTTFEANRIDVGELVITSFVSLQEKGLVNLMHKYRKHHAYLQPLERISKTILI